MPRSSAGHGLWVGALAVFVISVVVSVGAVVLQEPHGASAQAADDGVLAAGEVLRVRVPEAYGGKTVVGQLTIAGARARGYVTAFACDEGVPRDAFGKIGRSDLNFDGRVTPVASNRLIVQADADGDLCLYTSSPISMVVDVNAVTFDTGVTSFRNRRVDTRTQPASEQLIGAGRSLRVRVPEAAGGRTVVGQLTVARARGNGFVTAYGCSDGLPRQNGRLTRSDLNFDGRISAVASNRLIVRADERGDVCLYTSSPIAMVVDVNGVTDAGVTSFDNQRTDTRLRARGSRVLDAGAVLRVEVPQAARARTVLGQLTVADVEGPGFVTAYPCDGGLPRRSDGSIARSDVNFDGRIGSVASNRLIVRADSDGDVCFYTSAPAALVVDVSAVATGAAINSFDSRRVDTRDAIRPSGPVTPPGTITPVWPDYEVEPALIGVAALTGRPAGAAVTDRPVLVGKVDNFRRARPQFDMHRADAVIEVNVESVTRLMALFHSDLPATIGPLRSARTADLDLLPAMNRPMLAYSGANPGVTEFIEAAASSGVVADYSAQHRGCFRRAAGRPAPHNLVLDTGCALDAAADDLLPPGPARPLWTIDAAWRPGAALGARAAATIPVAMDGVTIEWRWDASRRLFWRFQDGEPHLSMPTAQADSAAGEEPAPVQVGVENVVVIEAVHEPSVVDARSPHPVTIGSGSGVVYRDGQAIEVTWARGGPYDRFTFFHPGSGLPVLLDEGRTWMHIIRR